MASEASYFCIVSIFTVNDLFNARTLKKYSSEGGVN